MHFIAIGHHPNTDISRLSWNWKNSIVTHGGPRALPPDQQSPLAFAAGDCCDHAHRQATSAGTGCMAALDAQRFLEQESDDTGLACPATQA